MISLWRDVLPAMQPFPPVPQLPPAPYSAFPSLPFSVKNHLALPSGADGLLLQTLELQQKSLFLLQSRL